MRIGVPKEGAAETRVGLTPFGVGRLVGLGHEVHVERHAGRAARFADDDYVAAGAKIVYQAEEVFGRADLVCKVGPLAPAEAAMAPPGTVVCGFHHLVVASREAIAAALAQQLTLIGYDTVADASGHRTVQVALSEIAAHQTVHTAAHLLQHRGGGRGILLGSIPGVPPATAVILGAGTLGRIAARLFLALGAHVILLDAYVEHLRDAVEVGGAGALRPVTALASARNLRRFTAIADVVVGAAVVPGGRAPFLVTEEMVRGMKPGSVILDLAIDQGGCVATSRPTSLDDPTFVAHGVIHHAVPNLTAAVPRTASRALTLAALPLLETLTEEGQARTLAGKPGLAAGIQVYRGQVVHPAVAGALGVAPADLDVLLAGPGESGPNTRQRGMP